MIVRLGEGYTETGVRNHLFGYKQRIANYAYRWLVCTIVVLWCLSDIHGAEPVVTVRQPLLVSSDRLLSLADCINLAQANQTTIRQAQLQISAQTGAVTQARSALLPSISANTSTQVAGNTRNGNTQITFSGNQLIYNFGHSSAQVRQAQALRAAGVQNLTGVTSDTVLNVRQAYYTLLQDTHLVDVFTQNLTQQQAHVKEAQAQEAVGVVPHTNVLTAQAAATSAEVDLVTAQNTANLSRANLNAAIGVDIRSPIRIVDAVEPEIQAPAEDQAVTLAMTRRAELRRDTDQVLAARAALKSAATGNLPALVASANYSPNPGSTGFGQQQSWALLLGVQWNFFNSGATTGAVQQARAQVFTAEETLYADRQSITNEVVQARLNLLAAQARLTSALVEVTSARANLESAVGSYQAGVGIFLAVIDAQAALLKAQVDEFTARYGLSMARAMLEHATGGTVP